MDAEAARYRVLREVFAEALERAPHERDAFLAQRCGADASLRREVEGLLAAVADGDGTDFLAEARIGEARSALEALARAGGPAEEPWLPERIGAYRIVRRLAAGGMGVVYEAEQSEPRRRVALKVVHPGQATPQRLQRFRLETRILGRLQHPGIAQIFEAGSFDLGRGEQPFYAMEFVEGLDVCTWAERAGLDLGARLALLAEICDAVHHAHRAGVVHRDLKPDNVLVGTDGRPKVLDFGVALAAGSETLLTTMVTEEGQLLGTLGFMAPEQLSGDSSRISPRTDVYALGVLAWMLLTGALPLDPAGLPLTAGIHMLMNREPPRLGKLRAQLRGDVETIVGKALEKEPGRRYESAEALAADLRRFLEHRPIAARPPSGWYLARKYARRHRGLVAAALALVLGLLGTGVFALVARRNERVARALEEAGRENLYFAEMQLASELAAEPTGAPRMRELVGHWLPATGAPDRRGWEWHLLHALSRRTEEVLPCAEGVLAARWHPTRDLFVTGERPARVYDAERGAFVAEVDTDWRSEDIAWSPTGDAVVLCGIDQARVLETDTWRTLADFREPASAGGVTWHPDGDHFLLVTAAGDVRRFERGDWTARLVHADPELFGGPGMVAYDVDGSRLLVLARGRNEARVLDATTWEPQATLSIVSGGNPFTCVTWAPDGAHVALGGAEGAIAIWRTADWRLERTLDGHRQFVTEVAWSPDGKRFLSAARDSSILLWDPLRGRVERQLRGHERIVEYASWSADGRRIVSASGDATLRLWDAERRPAAWTVWPQREGWHAIPVGRWSPDGRSFAHSQEGRTLVRRFQSDRLGPPGVVLEGRRPVWSLDGRLATLTLSSVRVHDAATGTLLQEVVPGPKLDWWSWVAWNPRVADRLAIANAGEVWLVDLDRGVVPRHLFGEPGAASQALQWSPDGEMLLLVGFRGTSLWSAADETLVAGPALGDLVLQGADWSPDGTRLALVPEDLTVRLLARDAGTGAWREEHALRGHTNQVHACAWSPDGTRIATASADGTVKVWEPASGRLAADLEAGVGTYHVSWSPDGRILTAAGFDGSIRVWDAGPEGGAPEARGAPAAAR